MDHFTPTSKLPVTLPASLTEMARTFNTLARAEASLKILLNARRGLWLRIAEHTGISYPRLRKFALNRKARLRSDELRHLYDAVTSDALLRAPVGSFPPEPKRPEPKRGALVRGVVLE